MPSETTASQIFAPAAALPKLALSLFCDATVLEVTFRPLDGYCSSLRRCPIGVTLTQPLRTVTGDLQDVMIEAVQLMPGIQWTSDQLDTALDFTPNLVWLQASDIGLKSVDDTIFDPARNTLRFMDLSNNLLTRVAPLNLPVLQALNLEVNLLTQLMPNTFAQLTNLNSLSLNGNRLATLPSGSFSHLTALRSLSLGANRFASMTSALFAGLSSLTFLDLSQNVLSQVPADLFQHTTQLEFLGMTVNRLPSLPDGLFAPTP